MTETTLEIERRHLRRAEELIAHQQELVRRLQEIGDSRTLSLAIEVLAGLRQSVKLGQDRIAYLERLHPDQAGTSGTAAESRAQG